MNAEAIYFLGAVVVGLGATLFMDLWALFLKYASRLIPGTARSLPRPFGDK